MSMTEKRLAKIKRVVKQRQPDLMVVLENVFDPHNIGAVLRTCDAVGVYQVVVLNNEPRLHGDSLILGKRTSSGARKWVDVRLFNDTKACYAYLRTKVNTILATHLGEAAKPIQAVDFCQSLALVFGNEHLGITEESLAHCDGNFLIPMAGMVESLNISVACAVTLYEAYRQRLAGGLYDRQDMDSPYRQELLENYVMRHTTRYKNKTIYRSEE